MYVSQDIKGSVISLGSNISVLAQSCNSKVKITLERTVHTQKGQTFRADSSVDSGWNILFYNDTNPLFLQSLPGFWEVSHGDLCTCVYVWTLRVDSYSILVLRVI